MGKISIFLLLLRFVNDKLCSKFLSNLRFTPKKRFLHTQSSYISNICLTHLLKVVYFWAKLVLSGVKGHYLLDTANANNAHPAIMPTPPKGVIAPKKVRLVRQSM